MMGDNIYGDDSPKGFAKKFEIPYKPLLDAGVPFYATLGNHDAQDQRFYKGFNMGGHRYYTFTQGSVQFFVMDTTYMDRGQLEWLEQSLPGITREMENRLRTSSVLFDGKEARLRSGSARSWLNRCSSSTASTPCSQDTSISTSGSRLRTASRISSPAPRASCDTATSGTNSMSVAGFDEDLSFMLIEVAGDTLYFEVISRTGATVDQGRFDRPADH